MLYNNMFNPRAVGEKSTEKSSFEIEYRKAIILKLLNMFYPVDAST